MASLFGGALALIAGLFFPIDRSWMALPLAAFALGSLGFAGLFVVYDWRRAAPPTQNAERMQRLHALGVQRARILGCLGGDFPSLPQYFDPAPSEDVVAAFRAFIEARVRDLAGESDRVTQSLLGAGRLLIGDTSGADAILEQLPMEPPVRDHFAGAALFASVQALMATLPIASLELAPASRWVAGSREQATVRAWLREHRSSLVWNERDAVYELGQRPEAEPGHAGGR